MTDMTVAQLLKITALSERYNVTVVYDDYRLDPLCGEGWVSGWVGGDVCAGVTVYVGISPDGESHS